MNVAPAGSRTETTGKHEGGEGRAMAMEEEEEDPSPVRPFVQTGLR